MTAYPRHTVRLLCLALFLALVLPLSAAMASTTDSVWVRIHHTSDDHRLQQRMDAELSDYGSFQWGRISTDDLETLRNQGARISVVENAFELNLGDRQFDPLEEFPATEFGWQSPGENFFLIQFQGPVRSEWLQDVRDIGIEPIQYIHPHTYVVWGRPGNLAEARGANSVRWTGEFLPEFRVLPQQRARDNTVVPTMALVSRHVDQDLVKTELEAAGAIVHRFTPVTRHTSVVYLEIAGDRYLELGHVPSVYTVQYIRPDFAFRGEMSNQSIVGNYGSAPNNTIFPGYDTWLTDTGYDGSGVVVGVVDSGIRRTHQDLVGQFDDCVPSGDTPTSCTSTPAHHGTHVAGAIAGHAASGTTDSNDFLRGQGVAPGARMVEQRTAGFTGSNPDFGFMIPDGMLTIFRESALSGAIIANNSWGPTGSPQGYDIPTQQIDIITRDATPEIEGNQGVLPVWSIMNGSGDNPVSGPPVCGPSSLGSPDEAKNLLGVGSTRLQTGGGAQLSNIFDIGTNSAHGPTCDGRTGLHIVAPGQQTDSTCTGGLGNCNSDSAYGLNTGTSFSAPIVSGAVAVFIERYRDLHGGADPSPAMIKAAVTAVATNLHGFNNADGGTITETPSRFQGYGRLDLDAVVNPTGNVMYFDQEHVFTNSGQDWSLPVIADDPDEPVRMMLMWTDAPGHGLGGMQPAWVNDLDLVVAAGSDTYFGNVLGSDGFSESGGMRDERNNAEAVFLRPDQHAGGVIDISVEAINIAEDALDPHEPGDPRQDFALVCYNCQFGDPTFTLSVEPEEASACIPETGSQDTPVDVTVGLIGEYTGTVSLSAIDEPAGVDSSFVPSSVEAPGSSVWTLSVDESASTGTSELQLIGDDGSEQKQLPFSLTLESPPAAPDLLGPIDDAIDVPLQPEFTWMGLVDIDDYTIQVATDAGFTNLVVDELVSGTTFTPGFDLAIGTDHYWRVRGQHHCGDGDWSPAQEFQTRFDPIADISPASLEFEVTTGDSDSDTLTITNVGSGVLSWTIETEACEGGDPSDWLSADPVTGSLPAEDFDAVEVTVNSEGLALGMHEAELCVSTNQADVDSIGVPVSLNVLDLPPGEITVQPTSLDFGEIVTGFTDTQTVQISNLAPEGSADLVINQIAVVAGQPTFEIHASDCGDTVPPQSDCTVEVRFSPDSVSNYSGALRVRADDQNTNIGLQGQGVEPEPEIFGDRFEELDQ